MTQEKESCDVESSCGTCDKSSSCSPEEREAHEREKLEERLRGIRHKLMVMSGKGGVGKTTVAINLGVVLAMEGLRVGLLDADIHGPNVPKMLGVELKPLGGARGHLTPIEVLPNLHIISMAYLIQNRDNPVVWRGPLKHSAISQFISEVEWGPLDFFIIDLPPGTGDEPLSVAHLIRNVDGSIVVTTPQDVALLDSRKSVNFSRVLEIPVIGIVENMSGMKCPHCGKHIPLFKIGGGERAAEELNVPFLGRIPIDPEMVQNCDRGMPFVMSYPNSEVTKAFQSIAQLCKGHVENKTVQGLRVQTAQRQFWKGGACMKRIALACDDNLGLEGQMSAHFGRCPYYTLVDVEDSDIIDAEVVANPYYNQHQPGVVPQFINTKGVHVMIAGGMGPRAIEMFNGFGIDVATGAMGKVENVVKAYLRGEISGVYPCEEHHGH